MSLTAASPYFSAAAKSNEIPFCTCPFFTEVYPGNSLVSDPRVPTKSLIN
jgi:hypothetical protein